MKRLVIMTGSFNPMTLAHIEIMKKAIEGTGSEIGGFVATSDKYLRQKSAKRKNSFILPEETRQNIIEQVCREDASMRFLGFEKKINDSYSIFKSTAKAYPDYEILYACGADKLKSIPKWKNISLFFEQFKLVVFERADVDAASLVEENEIFRKNRDSIVILPPAEGLEGVSSTEVRRRFLGGEDYSELVPAATYDVLSHLSPEEYAFSFEKWAKLTSKAIRFGETKVRTEVYNLNRDLFKMWASGEKTDVNLGDREALLRGTKAYKEPFDVCSVQAQYGDTDTGCINADCIDVAYSLIQKGMNPAILNFADRLNPCGKYSAGSRAQEESLCRASTLSQSLYQFGSLRRADVREAEVPVITGVYPMDTGFGGIYSPGVVFFRNGMDRWFSYREKPFSCGVISVSALCFCDKSKELVYRASDGSINAEGEELMLSKIRTVFRIAISNGHDSLVLGAFGCGAFHLPAVQVAQEFRTVLDEPEFRGKIHTAIFAILETGKGLREENGRFGPFYRIFGKAEL